MPRYALPLFAALCALALGVCTTSDDRSTATSTATPPASRAAIEDDQETEATLALVATRTEELFELDGASGPEISLLDDEKLADLIAELLADPLLTESVRRDEAFYSLLGLIPPGTDLLALNEELLNVGVAGLYRPEIDHLYVRLFGSFSSLEESTASHEYAHYLQDAGYDLVRMFAVVAGDRDAELALRALVEGDASYVQQQYVGEYFNEVQSFGMSFGGLLAASEAPTVPYVVTRETTFVYLDGRAWIGDLLASGVQRNEVYADPPRTTREILHPEVYTGTQQVTSVPIGVSSSELPANWSAGAPETIGELVLTTWLEEIAARGSAEATRGWVGDGLLVFSTSEEPVGFVARTWWSAPVEAEEFRTVAASALDRDPRYEPTTCTGCPDQTWDGPAGVFAVYEAGANTDEVVLAVAPSIDQLKQMMRAVR